MLGLKCFICSVLFWSSFGSIEANAVAFSFETTPQSIMLSRATTYQGVLVDIVLVTFEAKLAIEIYKVPVHFNSRRGTTFSYLSIDYKLLYEIISNTLALQLRSIDLIFPFHCFT